VDAEVDDSSVDDVTQTEDAILSLSRALLPADGTQLQDWVGVKRFEGNSMMHGSECDIEI